MRAFLTAALLWIGLSCTGFVGSAAMAQETEDSQTVSVDTHTAEAAEAAEGQPATVVRFDVETGERYALGRPADPARQGQLQVMPWMAYVAGGLTALFAVVALVRRSRPKRI